MCDPATAALVITTLSSSASFANDQAALGRQSKQAAEGVRRQGKIQREAGGRVNEQIADIAGSTGEPERAEALEGFLNALRTSQASTEGALDPIAAANPRFAEQVAGGRARIARTGTERAGRLARIDAPLRQRQREAGDIGRTTVDLTGLSRESDAEDFLTRLRIASEQPNAFIEALAGVGKGVGSVLALKPPVGKIVGGASKAAGASKIFG